MSDRALQQQWEKTRKDARKSQKASVKMSSGDPFFSVIVVTRWWQQLRQRKLVMDASADDDEGNSAIG